MPLQYAVRRIWPGRNGSLPTLEIVPPRLRTLLSRLRAADARRLAAPYDSAERVEAEREVERLARAIRGDPPDTKGDRPPAGGRSPEMDERQA